MFSATMTICFLQIFANGNDIHIRRIVKIQYESTVKDHQDMKKLFPTLNSCANMKLTNTCSICYTQYTHKREGMG